MNCHNKNYEEIILSAAKEIATAEGISKIAIRTVAEKCNIAIGTVYNYFPSKSELISAVIENFWEGAFTSIDWKDLSKNNFYANLEKIYILLHEYLTRFKVNWLDQLSLLSTQEKHHGKQKQDEYFRKIHQRVVALIEMDRSLNTYEWNDTITKEKMAKFIFDNMFIKLRENQNDIDFLIEILKKIFK